MSPRERTERIAGPDWSRRRWLARTASLTAGLGMGLVAAPRGVESCGVRGWFSSVASALAAEPSRKRQCILLWMAGGPSQTDTFDMKPGHANGGEFEEVSTSIPGIRFSEHLPKLGKQAEHLAIIRSLSTKEGDHGRGTYLMRTGRQPGGPIQYPAIGAALSKELDAAGAELPGYVSIGAERAFNPQAFGPGFLGPKYAPATVGPIARATDPANAQESPSDEEQDADQEDPMGSPPFTELGLDFLRRSAAVTEKQIEGRVELWKALQTGYLKGRPTANAIAQDTVYRRAIRMMNSRAPEAFDLSAEPDRVREAYGPSLFGQGCLMARRLIERGVPFVEVTLGSGPGGNWDTHQNNFETVISLSQQLDAGWGSLMAELGERGLLETTTVIWMGEFGRTPMINDNAGRDHFPAAWTCVLGGGGISGGQTYGRTSEDGREVIDQKVGVEQVLATLCKALGVDPSLQNITNLGRPIALVEGEPIDALLL